MARIERRSGRRNASQQSPLPPAAIARNPLPPGEGWVRVRVARPISPTESRHNALTPTLSRGEREIR
jgi:hypothetical protein